MEYAARIYSRIGELMQGILPDASAFLVSGIPSKHWFSEAVLRCGGPGAFGNRPAGSAVAGGAVALPQKAREALRLLERRTGRWSAEES